MGRHGSALAGNLPEPLKTLLLERYREPHRRYHNDTHLAAVLAAIELLATEVAADSIDLELVRHAAWFHDAVYDPHREDNEEVSAQLAEALLPMFGYSTEHAAEVARLVRLTGHHDAELDDETGALLCDADLAVLAGDPDTYADYAAAVRTEYAFVDDQIFRAERSAVLHRLLDRDYLFRSVAGQQLWEERARANITVELQLLSAQ